MPENMFSKVIANRKKKHVLEIENKEHVFYDSGQEAQTEHEPMTTTTVKAQRAEDFKPYAKLSRSNSDVQHHIALFLAKLVQATQPETVKQICHDELAWFLERYEGASARTTYMSAYRKAIQACFADRDIPEGLTVERQTTKGWITQHLALDLMMAPRADYEARQQQNRAKTDADQELDGV